MVVVNADAPKAEADFDPIAVNLTQQSTETRSLQQGTYQKYKFAATANVRYLVTVTPSSGDPDLHVAFPDSLGWERNRFGTPDLLRGAAQERYVHLRSGTGHTVYLLVYGHTAVSYTIDLSRPPPPVPVPVGPVGEIDTGRPVFEWVAALDQKWYRVAVYSNYNAAANNGAPIDDFNREGLSSRGEHQFPSVLPDGRYWWKVNAANDFGVSPYSQPREFTVATVPAPLEPPTVAASDRTHSDRIVVTWSAVPGATHYRVYRNTSSDPSASVPLSGWVSVTEFQDTEASDGAVYYYWVRAASSGVGDRQSDFSSSDVGRVKTAQTSLTVSSSPSGANVYLDDQDTGRRTPHTLTVTPGRRRVRVELEGYQPGHREVTLQDGQSLSVNIALQGDVSPPMIGEVTVTGSDFSTLVWDEIIESRIYVQATAGSGGDPDVVETMSCTLSSLETQRRYVGTLEETGSATNVFRGSVDIDEVITENPDEVEVAVVANFDLDSNGTYGDGEIFYNHFPEAARRGFAMGSGGGPNFTPPGNLEFFKAGGVERVEVAVGDVKDTCFARNQADWLMYSGHGWTSLNMLSLGDVRKDGDDNVRVTDLVHPSEVGNAWSAGEADLDGVIIAGCAVVDMLSEGRIGLEWASIKGPDILLGYRELAPGGHTDERIIERFLEVARWGGNPGDEGNWAVDAWLDANGVHRAWNATAILKGDEVKFGFFDYQPLWRQVLRKLGKEYEKQYRRFDWIGEEIGSREGEFVAVLGSPAWISVVDSQGRAIDESSVDIPGGTYHTTESGEKVVRIFPFNMTDSVRIVVRGYEDGLATLGVVWPDSVRDNALEFEEFEVNGNSVATLRLGDENRLYLDLDDDGLAEEAVSGQSAASSQPIASQQTYYAFPMPGVDVYVVELGNITGTLRVERLQGVPEGMAMAMGDDVLHVWSVEAGGSAERLQAILTFAYEDRDLIVGGEEGLVVRRYDTASGRWLSESATRDTVRNRLSVSVGDLGMFALGWEGQPTEPARAPMLLSLEVTPRTVSPGDSVRVVFNLQNAVGVNSGQYSLEYDRDALEVLTRTFHRGTLADESMGLHVELFEFSNGERRVSLFGEGIVADETGSVAGFTLIVNSSASAGQYALAPYGVVFFDRVGEAIPIEVSGSKIEVQAAVVEGPANDGSGDGWIRGDPTGDGQVTIADAVMIMQYRVHMIELTKEERLAADVDRDGDVDLIDAIYIHQLRARIIESLPKPIAASREELPPNSRLSTRVMQGDGAQLVRVSIEGISGAVGGEIHVGHAGRSGGLLDARVVDLPVNVVSYRQVNSRGSHFILMDSTGVDLPERIEIELALDGPSPHDGLEVEGAFFDMSGTVVGEAAPNATQVGVQIRQNQPNPFNSTTLIKFGLARGGEVTVNCYNLSGQLVRRLRNGQLRAGEHEILWDGKDDYGRDLASGVYLYRLSLDGQPIGVARSVLVR